MKKILVAVFALLSLAQLNALSLDEVLANKTLSKEVKNILQEQLKSSKNSYTIAGLIYAGPAKLIRTNNSRLFTLIQNDGYITYNLITDNSFNAYSFTIDYDKNNDSQNPHGTNTYNIILKLFKNEKVVVEQLAGVMELSNAGIIYEGDFYTNLAVNATFIKDKFYVLDQEPNTCGAQFDIEGKKMFKPLYETHTVTRHSADCKDPYHCSCPKEEVIAKQNYASPKKKLFTVQTQACKTDKTCKCPVYIVY